MEHRVFIGALNTDCRIDAAPDAAEAIRRSLDHGMRQLLPSRLADPLSRVLDGYDGVIRLRHLDISLALGSRLDPAAMADALAGRISDALRRALSSNSGDIAIWPSQNHYIAAYVEYRLSLAPAPSWAFNDFAALRHLSPSQAAAAILGDRPQALAVLARREHSTTSPARFVAALDSESALTLCATVLRVAKRRPADADLPAILKTTADVITANPTAFANAPLGQCTLRLALQVLTQMPEETPATKVLSVAGQVMSCLFVMRPNTATTRHAGLRDLLAQPHIHAQRLPKDWRDTFERALADPPTIATIAQLDVLLRRETNNTRPTTPSKGEKHAQNPPKPVQPQPIWTSYAGLALLASTLQRIGLARHLDARQLHSTALALLPEDHQKVAALDQGMNVLFPIDPHNPNTTPWPDLPPQQLAAATASTSAHLLQPGHDAPAWAGLILASFAQRLPGLTASSAPYLQRQFLMQPGQVIQTDETITVEFTPIPLGVVLSMSGLLGFQGRIQHLSDRTLILTMKRTA